MDMVVIKKSAVGLGAAIGLAAAVLLISQFVSGSVSACVPPPPGIISWWSGDGNANDIVGTNNGTLQNGATFSLGKVNQAFSLDGLDDFVNVGPGISFGTLPDFSIETWVKFNSLNSAGQWQTIISQEDVGLFVAVQINVDENERLETKVGDGQFLTGITTLQPGVFYHVALTKDSTGNVKLYLNGNLEGTVAAGPLDTTNQNLQIGRWSRKFDGKTAYWGGQIDEVSIYNRALTPIEIAAIVAPDSAGKCKPDTSNTFEGNAYIDNVFVPDGTLVEGLVNNNLCGSTLALRESPTKNYSLKVASATQRAGCGTDGATVTFRVGGLPASETGRFLTGVFTQLDLHATTPTVDTDHDGVPDNRDNCPAVAGLVARQGCNAAEEDRVILHTVNLGGGGSTRSPISGAVARVFDRNNAGFQALWTKNPSGTQYAQVFENGTGKIGENLTDATGLAVVGLPSIGDHLVIVKYVDPQTGKIVYTGLPKGTEDYKDTNADGVGDLAQKDLRVLKVIKKDGSVQLSGGGSKQFTGSLLEIVYPVAAMWEAGLTKYIYPFIFTSDSNWTTDVCASVPAGYKVTGTYDETGTLIGTASCAQAFVTGQTKVLAFEVTDIASPKKFKANFKLKVKNPNGKVKDLDLDVDSEVPEIGPKR